jgi:hypothetical protein
VTYGNIPSGGTAVNPDPFVFTIDAAAPNGHAIHFDLTATADNGGPWFMSFDVVVGQGTMVGPLVYASATIDDDNNGESVGNGDGIINPGEVIELDVEILNTGNTVASSTQGCINEYSPYVGGFLDNACSTFGDVPGGSTAVNTDDFDFEVNTNTPNGHMIYFCLALNAANGGPWDFCFDLPVESTAPGTTLRIAPANQDVPLSGGTFQVDVMVEDVIHLGAFQFDLIYNPATVHVEDAELGPFLGSTGCTPMDMMLFIDNATGRLTYTAFVLGACNGPSGGGVAATVTLHPETAGDSDLTLADEQLMNTNNPPTPITPVNLYHGHVEVTDCWFADVNCDDTVNIADIYNVAYRWGCQCGEACYDPAYDLNDDCTISVSDIQIAACYFGWPNGDFSGCYAPAGASMAPMTDVPATLRLTPEETHLQPGDSLTLDLTVEQAQDVAGFEVLLHYDPHVLDFKSLTPGGFLARTGNTVVPREAQVDPGAGTVTLGGFSFGEQDSPDGSGTLVSLAFTVRGLGESPLMLSNAQLAHGSGHPQPTPTVVGGRAISRQPLYLPLICR